MTNLIAYKFQNRPAAPLEDLDIMKTDWMAFHENGCAVLSMSSHKESNLQSPSESCSLSIASASLQLEFCFLHDRVNWKRAWNVRITPQPSPVKGASCHRGWSPMNLVAVVSPKLPLRKSLPSFPQCAWNFSFKELSAIRPVRQLGCTSKLLHGKENFCLFVFFFTYPTWRSHLA